MMKITAALHDENEKIFMNIDICHKKTMMYEVEIRI